VAPGGYSWWYVDALSDDGRHGLSIIAFVGSVFSPYYAWKRRRGPGDPEDHCAINVALYGSAGKRWTMTERGRPSTQRDAQHLRVGPSQIAWDGERLRIDFDERGVPFPHRVKGSLVLRPHALSPQTWALDDAGRHLWGPIAARADIEVTLQHPAQTWRGQAYFDANAGNEPIERPFQSWDWSRAHLADGSTGVIYDVRQKQGPDRVLALRLRADGSTETFEPAARQRLPATRLWRVERHLRSEGPAAQVLQTFEDTPFYSRSVMQAQLLGESALTVHESLNVPRLTSGIVQAMLPWRMPRRR
jgi:carotenoid 1,2-hydratase